MDARVFGTFTGTQFLLFGGATLAAILLLVVLIRLLSKPKVKDHIQRVHCTGCGWRGEVSRYAGVCPRCNNPLGERKAKR